MSAHLQNLGDFAKLPPEIRDQIWKELRPCASFSRKEYHDILRTCHQINREARLHLDEIIHIRLSLMWSPWLTVECIHGSREIPCSDHLLARWLSNLLCKKLDHIVISIDGPKNDPEFLALTGHLQNLADTMKNVILLPSLDIYLCGQWRAMNEKIPPFITDNPTKYDYGLLPFCILRKVPSVRIHANVPTREEAAMIAAFERVMQRLKRVDTTAGSEHDPWSDRAISNSLDRYFMLREVCLDTFTGETANMMRLERFRTWYTTTGYSEYLIKIERVLERQDSEQPQQALFHRQWLRWRHDLLLQYNPLSANMQRTRLQLGLPPHLRSRDFILRDSFDLDKFFEYLSMEEDAWDDTNDLANYRALSILQSCWSSEAWRSYYPNGIPPLLQRDYFEMNKVIAFKAATRKENGIPLRNYRGDFEDLLYNIRKEAESFNFSAGEETRVSLKRDSRDLDVSYLVADLESIQTRPTKKARRPAIRTFLNISSLEL